MLMKNSKIIFISFFIFFFKINSLGEEFNFKSNEIQILEKGNLILAENGVKIIAKDNLKIEGDKSEYNKKENSLKIFVFRLISCRWLDLFCRPVQCQ